MILIPSAIRSYTELTGGHHVSTPAILYGPPKAGKSILMLHFAYDFLADSNVLYVDTEGGSAEMISLWKPTLDKRYGINAEMEEIDPANIPEPKDRSVIYVLNSRHIRNILKNHGYLIDLDVSEGKDSVPKINLRFSGMCDNTVMKLVKSHKIRMMIYDSISAPLRTAFIGGRLQFPARADTTALWMGSILELCDSYPIVTYMSLHESYDPANPYATPHIRGPMAVQYMSKIHLYLDPSKSSRPELKNTRKLWLVRYFINDDWSKYAKLKLTDSGYVDQGVDKDE
jgi:hypothetical protein